MTLSSDLASAASVPLGNGEFRRATYGLTWLDAEQIRLAIALFPTNRSCHPWPGQGDRLQARRLGVDFEHLPIAEKNRKAYSMFVRGGMDAQSSRQRASPAFKVRSSPTGEAREVQISRDGLHLIDRNITIQPVVVD